MSRDPSLAIQKAVVAKLKLDVPLVNNRVYDQVPEPAQLLYPYISLGEFQAVDDSADCIDSKELFVTLHAWSREQGTVEVKRIADQICMSLDDKSLDLSPDYNWVLSQHETTRTLKDPDGTTKHAVITIRVVSTAR